MRLLRKLGRGWLKFAEILGNIQMVLILSIVYWVMVLILALPLKLLRDPLTLKGPRPGGWVKRIPATGELESGILESMRKQG